MIYNFYYKEVTVLHNDSSILTTEMAHVKRLELHAHPHPIVTSDVIKLFFSCETKT